jgi:hypothetical protein
MIVSIWPTNRPDSVRYFPQTRFAGALITSALPTKRELSGRLHFLSVGRYAVKVRPLLVDNIRFRLVNKPGCQHEKIGACVPLTTIIGV